MLCWENIRIRCSNAQIQYIYNQKPHTLRSPRNYIWSSISLYTWSNSCIFHKCSCRKGFAKTRKVKEEFQYPPGSKILIKHLGAGGFNVSRPNTSHQRFVSKTQAFPEKLLWKVSPNTQNFGAKNAANCCVCCRQKKLTKYKTCKFGENSMYI